MSPSSLRIGTFTLVALSTMSSLAAALPREKEITLENERVKAVYHLRTGMIDLVWRDGSALTGVESGAQLADGRVVASSAYPVHEVVPSSSGEQGAREITVKSSGPGMPSLLQHFHLSQGKPWISVQAELDSAASAVGTRRFDAVMLKGPDGVRISKGANLRVLHVPYDNDMWFRYKSELLSDLKPKETFSSDEVTAIYDNQSRAAIVVGSITHDLWKTAIDLKAQGGSIASLDVYGGITAPTGVRTDTHDTVPHGIVHGARVLSPRIFIGSYSDWRAGLEAYGDANAAVHPPLQWPGDVPVGWNSWAAYGDKIDYSRYLGAAAFVHDVLTPEGFARNKIVYVNLDAFWSRLDAAQLADAVKQIKSMRGTDGTRFEPGIYWTPFAYWSDDLDAWVEGTGMKYRYRDILLKSPDGALLPKVDGGRPIDPSHPGTKARISWYLQQFRQMGFSYLKLDFLSHGALEGQHFDPAVQTGVQAYNEGMQQIVDEAGKQMFLSLSIAPLFPSGYGHARRLSCDTKGHIGGGDQSTEYMLNSLTYGWWTNKRLYIADPDHVVLGEKADLGARNVTEGKSRLLSAIIASGMILDSSRLADDEQGRELARQVYDARKWLAVGDRGEAFQPIEGDSGSAAAPVFIGRFEHGYYLAAFNYDEKQPRMIDVSLNRIDPMLAEGHLAIADAATGETEGTAGGILHITLQPAQSKLLEIRTQ